MRPRLPSLLVALCLIASPVAAQIPEAPGNPGGGPRDEHPGHAGGAPAPAVVPTESEASPPEIIDLMKRSRANAEATHAEGKPKRTPVARRKPTPVT